MSTWKHKLRLKDVFHNEEMTFEQIRDTVVCRIRASSWFKRRTTDMDLLDIVDELSEASTGVEFDPAWSAFYDWADTERVWVETQ